MNVKQAKEIFVICICHDRTSGLLRTHTARQYSYSGKGKGAQAQVIVLIR